METRDELSAEGRPDSPSLPFGGTRRPGLEEKDPGRRSGHSGTEAPSACSFLWCVPSDRAAAGQRRCLRALIVT